MTQKLWMIRAGSNGELEEIALRKGLVAIRWNRLPDLNLFKTREALAEEYQKHYKEGTPVSEGLKVGQIFRFAQRVHVGDIVVLPSKFAPEIHVGEVTGPYQYKQVEEGVLHWIPVNWLKTIPRSQFDEDLLYSFGSLLTLSNIKRNNALERVKAMISGGKVKLSIPEEDDSEMGDDTLENAEPGDIAFTQIESYIQKNFHDYALEDLIREILTAHGYTTSQPREVGGLEEKSRKGEDGGADILASNGQLGFEEPKICIQVKSNRDKIGAGVLRELLGVMNSYNAHYGILVSWSGFSEPLKREARSKYFNIRLWSSKDIIDEIFNHYDKFSEEMKKRLPLKRIWVLVE
ncbi:MAG: restriction endonuclease [Chitinophagales bacterium]